jgi:hypothetical protein
MNLTLIDNCFFKLSPTQAKELCMENKLPRAGYAMKADKSKLDQVKLGEIDGHRGPNGTWVEFNFKAKDAREAWVQRTTLSHWKGKPVINNWVWALQLCY